MPSKKISDILKLDDDSSSPRASSSVLYGPRQLSAMSITASYIMQAVLNSVAIYGTPMLPEKITTSNKNEFEALGLTVEIGDMVYEIEGEYINATSVLTAPSTAFEHTNLDYRKKTLEDIQRLAEYLAHNGTSGRKSYSKEYVTFNLVHGTDGDGHKALKEIEELDKRIHQCSANLERVTKIATTPQEKLRQATNRVLQDTIDKLSITLEKMKHEKSSHQHIVDEQTMHSGQEIRSILRKKIKSASKKKKGLLLENPINRDAIKSIELEISDIKKLFKLNDAQLVAARLYTGVSFTHINAIGNKVIEALRDWTEEEFSNNLLVAAVILDTINRHSILYNGEPLYRIESKAGRKEQEAMEAQAAIEEFETIEEKRMRPPDEAVASSVATSTVNENLDTIELSAEDLKAIQEQKERLSDAVITKSGLTSTMRDDYAIGFLETDSTLTIIYKPQGLSISALSYWQKENELLVQPGQYVVIKLGEAEHKIDDDVYEDVEFQDRHEHSHPVIHYAAVITSADDALVKHDNNRIHQLRVAKDNFTPTPAVSNPILRSYSPTKTINYSLDSIDSPHSTISVASALEPLIPEDSNDLLDQSEWECSGNCVN